MDNDMIEGKDNFTVRPTRRHRFGHLLAALLLVSNAATFLVTVHFFYGWHWLSHTRRPLQSTRPVEAEKQYTDFDINLHPVEFTAFKFVPNEFTGIAGDDNDVDSAWESIGVDYNRVIVPSESAVDFGLTDDHVFLTADNIANSSHLDRPGYPAHMGVFHQLHCLNLVRQALYFNVDYYRSQATGAWEQSQQAEDDKWIQSHIRHCVDMIRQLLMCHADVDVIPYFWRNPEGGIVPDYIRDKQCRNFEAIQDWARDHLDLLPEGVKLTPPSSATFVEKTG